MAGNNRSGGVSQDTPGLTPRTIVVGIEAGTPSPSLNDESLGWQLAFREANDSGGLHGRRVEVKIYDCSERIENWESGDIMPPVTLSAEDHHAQKAGRICELQDGRFKALTDWVVAE